MFTVNFLNGASLFSIFPISLNFVAELTFPVEPALMSGILIAILQLTASVISVLLCLMCDVDPNNYDSEEDETAERQARSKNLIYIGNAIILVAFVCALFIKEDLKRLRYRTSMQEQSTQSSIDQVKNEEESTDGKAINK